MISRFAITLFLMLLALAGFAPAGLAQSNASQANATQTDVANGIKIGFVDIPFLIDEAPQSKAASIRLEREFAPRQELIKEQKSELDQITQELDGDSVDNTRRALLEREFRKTERRVKRDEQEFREELNIQKNQEFKQVRVYVLDAIATFAKRHGYDMIISDGVLFANKTVDVTDKVLFELQQSVSQAGNQNTN